MAGPYCGMLLGDLGADVIKIENPVGGDYSRGMPPFNAGEGAGFLLLNRNKRSLALDLKREPAREIFLELIDTADVVVENFRPGTMRHSPIAAPSSAEARRAVKSSSFVRAAPIASTRRA